MSLLSLFRGNDVKAFETAAIVDEGGAKTATNGGLTDRLLCNLLTRRWIGHLLLALKPPFLEKSIQKVAYNINAFIHNANQYSADLNVSTVMLP